jgi:hypothetical protein
MHWLVNNVEQVVISKQKIADNSQHAVIGGKWFVSSDQETVVSWHWSKAMVNRRC